ncbi:hypothetical protein K470DRAFT_272935 [Piedraia hortae CBS 480.64]|uniref:Uncharacterized protein n=1 Tax=Piedraia hortae CBS 480.64 TaxID=1314780 RepID=A0A6A7BRH3_9PEZI|nr:hypothetical protein K470DRAFT_272935 [Piedraia hortae CBS 480.64]
MGEANVPAALHGLGVASLIQASILIGMLFKQPPATTRFPGSAVQINPHSVPPTATVHTLPRQDYTDQLPKRYTITTVGMRENQISTQYSRNQDPSPPANHRKATVLASRQHWDPSPIP